ncbi:hypothetical protein C8024_16800 [Sphingopyxis sp. BSNA05]|nr:hypothetical protein [Sphingopyxis sp. BSNA05]
MVAPWRGIRRIFQTSLQSVPVRRFSRRETEILDCLATGMVQNEIVEKLDITPSELAKFLESLNFWGKDVVRWRHPAGSQAAMHQKRLRQAARLRDMATAMTATVDANDIFHKTRLTEGNRQFDQIETTISHMFREPHIALDNRSYGEAFCDWLVANGRLKSPCRVIEIGCGLGFFANAIMDRLQMRYPDLYEGLSYTLFDLSPELQSAQKSNCGGHVEKTHFVSGNIESHDFGDQQFDLVLSNEVIADLNVATVSLDNVQRGTPQTDAETVVHRYRLNCVPITQGNKKVAVINFGAIKMLENIAKCLAKNGYAVVTEYGTRKRSPKAVKLTNHYEYTIHFGQLEQVSQHLGFQSDHGTMGDVIGFSANCETIHMKTLRTLSTCLIPYLGREALPVLAYTPASLEAALGDIIARIGNLQFLRLDDRASFSPFRFELLSLSSGSANTRIA